MRYLTFLMLCVFTGCFGEQQLNKLSVSGHATVYVPADKLTLSVGVVTQNTYAQVALRENSDRMNQVINALKKTGLKEGEFQTGQFSVNPTYTQPPKNPPPNWQQTISGYEVRNTINIRTNHFELAGQIIDEVGAGGANLIDNISFVLDNPQPSKNEAITLAVQQAIDYAETAARAAKVNLGNLLELSINPSVIAPHYKMNAFAAAGAEIGTPIQAGNVEVQATASLVYEIK